MRRTIVRTSCLAMLLALSTRTAPARAQDTTSAPSAGDTITLTFAEARRLALSQNPEFLAERQGIAIARGQLRQARLPAFNPELDVGLPGLATGRGAAEYQLSLMQEVEVGGQRGLRVRAGRLGVRRAELTVRDAARLAVADVTTAYFASVAARRRLTLAEEILALNERLMSAVRIQLAEGEVSAMEGNLAEIELGRARAGVLAARREVASADLELGRAAGLAPTVGLRVTDDLPAAPAPDELRPDSLLAAALAARPDLAARAAAAQEFQALGELARRQNVPNLRVGALAEREADGRDPRFGVGVGVSLPILNRNQGTNAERRAQAEQAALQGRAVELRVRTQVEDAYRAYVAASQEAAVYESTILQPARSNRALLETAYRAGKIGLATLLLVRDQLLEAELGYWDSWLAQRRALVALEAATASAVPPLSDLETSAGDNDHDR